MSAAEREMLGRPLIRKNHQGVPLWYWPEAVPPGRDDPKPRFSDWQRMRVLKAERAVVTLGIIAEHAELSEIALMRIADELTTIRTALNIMRPALGMSDGR